MQRLQRAPNLRASAFPFEWKRLSFCNLFASLLGQPTTRRVTDITVWRDYRGAICQWPRAACLKLFSILLANRGPNQTNVGKVSPLVYLQCTMCSRVFHTWAEMLGVYGGNLCRGTNCLSENILGQMFGAVFVFDFKNSFLAFDKKKKKKPTTTIFVIRSHCVLCRDIDEKTGLITIKNNNSNEF